METTLWIELLLIAVAILANGLFAGSEIALVSSRIGRLAEMRQKGVRGAAAAFGLKESPEAFLATIQIAITLVGALASAVGGAAAVARLTPVLEKIPLPGAPTWAGPVALGIVILVVTYFSLVIGELTPKALALRDPERLACAMAPLVARLTRVFAAVVRLLTVSTNFVLRLLGQGQARSSSGPPRSVTRVSSSTGSQSSAPSASLPSKTSSGSLPRGSPSFYPRSCTRQCSCRSRRGSAPCCETSSVTGSTSRSSWTNTEAS